MEELCRCGHNRKQHADHENALQVVPLGMTDVDEGDRGSPDVIVSGAGPCTVSGCGCEAFTDLF